MNLLASNAEHLLVKVTILKDRILLYQHLAIFFNLTLIIIIHIQTLLLA